MPTLYCDEQFTNSLQLELACDEELTDLDITKSHIFLHKLSILEKKLGIKVGIIDSYPHNEKVYELLTQHFGPQLFNNDFHSWLTLRAIEEKSNAELMKKLKPPSKKIYLQMSKSNKRKMDQLNKYPDDYQ